MNLLKLLIILWLIEIILLIVAILIYELIRWYKRSRLKKMLLKILNGEILLKYAKKMNFYWRRTLQLKKLKKLLLEIPGGEILLKYANTLKIKMEINNGNEKIWEIGIKRKIVFAPLKVVEKNKRSDVNNPLFGLVHEIGHLEYSFFPIDIANPFICPKFQGKCIIEEWEAWLRGWNIIRRLQIPAEPKKYWRYVVKQLSGYYQDKTLLDCFEFCILTKNYAQTMISMGVHPPVIHPSNKNINN